MQKCTGNYYDETKMRTRQKQRAATDTRRSPGCRTTPPEHRSKRKQTNSRTPAGQATDKKAPDPTNQNKQSGPSPRPTPDPPARNQRGKQSHQLRPGQTPSMQTALPYLCHIQHVSNARQFFRIGQKN